MEVNRKYLKELLNEDLFDVPRDLAGSICKYLDSKNFYNYELVNYDSYPMDTSKITFEVDGDWKHDHLRFKDLVYDWSFENNKNIFKIDSELVRDDGSDSYASNYFVYVTKDEDALSSLKSMSGLFSESVVYPNGMPASDIDIHDALNFNFGLDRDMNDDNYTDEEKQRSIDYWIKKIDGMHEDLNLDDFMEPIDQVGKTKIYYDPNKRTYFIPSLDLDFETIDQAKDFIGAPLYTDESLDEDYTWDLYNKDRDALSKEFKSIPSKSDYRYKFALKKEKELAKKKAELTAKDKGSELISSSFVTRLIKKELGYTKYKTATTSVRGYNKVLDGQYDTDVDVLNNNMVIYCKDRKVYEDIVKLLKDNGVEVRRNLYDNESNTTITIDLYKSSGTPKVNNESLNEKTVREAVDNDGSYYKLCSYSSYPGAGINGDSFDTYAVVKAFDAKDAQEKFIDLMDDEDKEVLRYFNNDFRAFMEDRDLYIDDATKEEYDSFENSFGGLEESLNEASYGGAFDIEDDMYFTKEELVEFAGDVAEEFSKLTGHMNCDVDNVYMENDPLALNVDIYDPKDEVSHSAYTRIDMRKIRKPSDIYKYMDRILKQLEDSFHEYHENDFEDAD